VVLRFERGEITMRDLNAELQSADDRGPKRVREVLGDERSNEYLSIRGASRLMIRRISSKPLTATSAEFVRVQVECHYGRKIHGRMGTQRNARNVSALRCQNSLSGSLQVLRGVAQFEQKCSIRAAGDGSIRAEWLGMPRFARAIRDSVSQSKRATAGDMIIKYDDHVATTFDSTTLYRGPGCVEAFASSAAAEYEVKTDHKRDSPQHARPW